MSSSVYISYSYIDEYINTGNSICTFFAATSSTTGSTVSNTSTTIINEKKKKKIGNGIY